jgi:lactate 2-monooxygenase
LPFLYGKGIAQYVTDPIFMESLDEVVPNERESINWNLLKAAFMAAKKVPGSTFSNLKSGTSIKAVQQFISTYSRPNLTWNEIETLVKRTRLPVLLKGIQREEDAVRAIDAGVSGIIVSNHGGRQVDGAVGSFEMLRKIAPAVRDKIKVLFDSGIRSGSDVVKAIAAGAHACLIGRPYVYALALAGQQGVEELLKNYIAEIELTMGLCGLKTIDEIDERIFE